MAKKKKVEQALMFEKPKPKEKQPKKLLVGYHVTRSTDAQGRVTDYIRCETCKGKGCHACSNLGFTKQLVAL